MTLLLKCVWVSCCGCPSSDAACYWYCAVFLPKCCLSKSLAALWNLQLVAACHLVPSSGCGWQPRQVQCNSEVAHCILLHHHHHDHGHDRLIAATLVADYEQMLVICQIVVLVKSVTVEPFTSISSNEHFRLQLMRILNFVAFFQPWHHALQTEYSLCCN